MAEYLASFKRRFIPTAISSYFARASSAVSEDAYDGVLRTVSSGVPAYDGTDGLILEAAATNLITYSDQIDNAAWSKSMCSVTANSITSPDGGTNADVVVEDTASGPHQFAQGFSLAADTSVVLTALVKRVVGTRNVRITAYTASHGLRATFNLDTLSVTNGSYGTATFSYGLVEAAGDGWYWLTLVGKPSATETNPTLGFNMVSGTSTTSYVGDGVSSLSFWRIGAEVGTFRTSSIQTVASTVTRAASYLGPIPVGDMGIASQTNEYSIAFAVRMPYSSAATPGFTTMFTLGVDNADRAYVETSSVTGRIQLSIYTSNNLVQAQVSGLTWSVGDVLLVAVSKGAANGGVIVVNGNVATNTSATAKAAFSSAATTVRINDNQLGGGYSFGTYLGFRIWDTALSQAQLEALTPEAFDNWQGYRPSLGLFAGLEAPMSDTNPRGAFPITPSDSATVRSQGLYVGDSGTIAFVPVDNTSAVTLTVPAGWYWPGPIKQVLATGTTCTKIHGMAG